MQGILRKYWRQFSLISDPIIDTVAAEKACLLGNKHRKVSFLYLDS